MTKPSLYGQPPETPEPLAAWAPVPFQQLDMLEHLIAALDWEGMDDSNVVLALGLGELLRLRAAQRAMRPASSVWVFDGFRRTYHEYQTSGWEARFVIPGPGPMPLASGRGATLTEALGEAMLAAERETFR